MAVDFSPRANPEEFFLVAYILNSPDYNLVMDKLGLIFLANGRVELGGCTGSCAPPSLK